MVLPKVMLALMLAVFAGEDIFERELKNKYLIVSALIALPVGIYCLGFTKALVGALTGGSISAVLWYLGAIGGGDVKLLAVCGLLAGTETVIKITAGAVLLAGIFGAGKLMIAILTGTGSGKLLKMETAFVPFIFIAAVLLL